LLLLEIVILLSGSRFNPGYAYECPVYKTEIVPKVVECEAKFQSVYKKDYLFIEGMPDYQHKKDYYLKLVKDFRSWLDQSKIILRTLLLEEVQQNLNDFNFTCQDYTTQIREFLNQVEGIQPSGGFSMPNTDRD
jgi:hypothetical protein